MSMAPSLTSEHLRRTIAAWKGMSPSLLGLTPPDPSFYAELQRSLEEQILGQNEVIEAVIAVLRRRGQIATDGTRPGVKASFLFAGPSGTGKTFLSEELARGLFGEDRHIRIDGSSYDQEHHLARLVGAPPGYVGYGTGGSVTNAVRDLGFGVICWDELDKAHPTLAKKILIPGLEQGVVADMNLDDLDISQFVVTATCNLDPSVWAAGGAQAREKGREARAAIEERAREALNERFPAEVLGRFDAVLIFRPLNRRALSDLAERELDVLSRGLLGRDPPVGISVERDVLEVLVDAAKSPLGARGLLRAFHDTITSPVEKLLDRNPNQAGTVSVSTQADGSLRFAFQWSAPENRSR